METTKTTENVTVDTKNSGGEGETVESISIPKTEYDTLNQTLGSLKKEIKDLKKAPKDELKETHKNSKESEEFGLLHKTYLRAAGVITEDEVELARKIQKETGMDWDKVPDSKYFKLELEELRTSKANATATSNIRGGQGKSDAKNTPEYWIAKGTPPSATDVPDRKVRTKIALAMMNNAKSSKKFYND